jgi:hypothetical protein
LGQDAGGIEHLAACVRSVWEVESKWLEVDPAYPKLGKARAMLAACEAKLSNICDATSRLARSLRAERDVAAAQVEATVEALTDRRFAQARALVERAARADEQAIKELVSLAAGCPGAFPDNFAAAFDCLTPSDEQLVG